MESRGDKMLKNLFTKSSEKKIKDELIKDEIDKWSDSAKKMLIRLNDTQKKLQHEIDSNKIIWEKILKSDKWDEESLMLSVEYIKKINELICAIERIENIKISRNKKT
tara:strand:+ start:855 stop:1178 length:324 start_codon:yes stop_codon:yes gene_type:complete